MMIEYLQQVIKYMQRIVKVTLLILGISNLISSFVIGLGDNSNKDIKATFTGVITSLFAIISFLLMFNVPKYNYSKKILKIYFFILLIVSSLGFLFEFLLGFKFGGWGLILCMFSALWLINQNIFENQIKNNGVVQEQIYIPLTQQMKNNAINSAEINLLNEVQDAQKKSGWFTECCFYWHGCFSIMILLLIAFFTSIAIALYITKSSYPAYGKIIEIETKEYYNRQKYYIHAYCMGKQHPTRPTIILEHAEGSNSMAFAELASLLSQKNWKVCAYDRLGYGRSSVIPGYISRSDSWSIGYSVIQKLVQNDTNQKTILGGWSEGVEICQMRLGKGSSEILGMIFMDGYPNKQTLQAIYDNKSAPYAPSSARNLQILRIFQPLGLAFLPGSNPIQNKTLNNYYRAYHQTGYYWQTQYFEKTNPDASMTELLTSFADNSTAPYPDAQIDLNWPDIDIPLLILPANQTLNSQQYKGMYEEQCNKYLDKCTNPNKKISIMKGDHEFILKSPADVANQIDKFFAPIFE